MAPTQTRTITRFTRVGLEGRVTGYTEITVPASSATAKNSTSLLRKPANRADFVRGAAGFYPFAPGGLGGVEAAAALDDVTIGLQKKAAGGVGTGFLDKIISLGPEEGLLDVPPGFTRGLRFEQVPSSAANEDAEDVEQVLNESAHEPQDEEQVDVTTGPPEIAGSADDPKSEDDDDDDDDDD